MSTETETISQPRLASSKSDDPDRASKQRFRPLSVQRTLLKADLRANAKHVGLTIALLTSPERLEVAIKMSELCRLTGRGEGPVSAAIGELVAAGLLVKVRRGSVPNVYRWAETIYDVAGVVVARESYYNHGSGEYGACLRALYLAERERRHAIPVDADPGFAVGVQTEAIIVDRFRRLAEIGVKDGETTELAFARLLRRGLRDWMMNREGSRGFLLQRLHPIGRFAEDIDWVTARLRLSSKDPTTQKCDRESEAKEPAEETPEQAEERREALDDLRRRLGIKRAAAA